MKDERMVGVNYWPIESGMAWWRSFDEGLVDEDFSRISESNLEKIRVFLLWEDFQPLPNKVSVKTLDLLVRVMDLARKHDLRIMPTLFTGHMSGMNYLPPWMLESGEVEARFPVFSEGKRRKKAIRNGYTDREVREAQRRFAREVAIALQGHPALFAWDLGNEPSNVSLPPSRDQARIWLEEIVSELKKWNENVPVTLGLHQQDLEEDRKMGPQDVATFCDFLSMHAYPFYAKWAHHPMDDEVVPFLGLLTQWLGSKEVLIEEVGISCANELRESLVFTEEEAYEFYERLLKRLRRYPFLGVLFWCYGDYDASLWDQPPFNEKKHERYFGLFRRDRSPKSFVPLVKEFRIEPSSLSFRWIDIDREDYFRDPMTHLSRLYRRFKEMGAGLLEA